MIKLFSLEFLVAVLFILDIFLFFLIFLIVKRVNRSQAGGRKAGPMIVDDTGRQTQEEALESAGEVLGMLEPLVKESQEAAAAFDDLIREKRKISRDLNDALDSRIISINLLLSRAATLQKQMEEQQQRMSQTVSIPAAQSLPPREPDVLDQQNQIIQLYQNKMNVDTIAEQLSIPKGEVQLVVDLKEKFMAMEQEK